MLENLFPMIKLPQILRLLAVWLLSTAFTVTPVYAASHAGSDGPVDQHASAPVDDDELADPDCD